MAFFKIFKIIWPLPEQAGLICAALGTVYIKISVIYAAYNTHNIKFVHDNAETLQTSLTIYHFFNGLFNVWDKNRAFPFWSIDDF